LLLAGGYLRVMETRFRVAQRVPGTITSTRYDKSFQTLSITSSRNRYETDLFHKDILEFFNHNSDLYIPLNLNHNSDLYIPLNLNHNSDLYIPLNLNHNSSLKTKRKHVHFMTYFILNLFINMKLFST